MELHKMKMADVRGIDASKIRETEKEIRLELAKIRMDIYTAKSAHAGKIKGLKTALARLLTVETELNRAKPKAPKAPKAAAAPKAPKAAKAPKADAKPKAAKAPA